MSFGMTSQMLDACVLAVVNREDVYGYVLTQNIRSIMDISESTLYPVLRRLQKDGLLETYDQPFNGRNRRFYKITDSGKAKLAEYLAEWQQYKANLDTIFTGGKCDE
ncbi:MAG: PadR family transcriptional regulator [Clostridia bacterium]|nr:PadR family transcriptional regulator [Clostridia bacterium]